MGLNLAEMKDGLALLAIVISLASPVVVALLSKTFSSKGEHAALEKRVADMAARLAAGETRFAQLEGAIKIATQAARDAKTAAEETAVAAAKVHGAEVAIARLEERIKSLGEALDSIEHFTRLMVEGHMKMRA